MENKSILIYLKLKNFWEDSKSLIKAGAVFWIGIALLIIGIAGTYSHFSKQTHKLTYASDTVSTSQGIKTIRTDIRTKKPFTLVLYNPTCPDCKKAQKGLMKAYWKAKDQQDSSLKRTLLNQKTDYLIMNSHKIQGEQRAELIRMIPQIAVYGDKFEIPCVVNVIPDKDGVKIAGLSQDDQPKNYEPVLRKSTHLEEMRQ